MKDLETFCKLKIAEARRDLRAIKKHNDFDMEASHKKAFAWGVISAHGKVLTKLKQMKSEKIC